MGRNLRVLACVLVAGLAVAGLSGITSHAGAAGSHPPIGGFDALTVKFDPGTVANPNGSTYTLSGWAADRDAPGQPVDVHVYVNGRSVTATKTGLSRPDVARGRPWAGPATGWQVKLTYLQVDTRGAVCAYALDRPRGGPSTLLGCKNLAPAHPGDPIGTIDSVTATPGAVRIRGWAGDPDGYRTTRLRIYVDEYHEPIHEAVADLPRPSVKAVHPRLSATTGFDITLPVVPGRHIICVVAGNTGPSGYHHLQFRCFDGNVPGARPPGPHDPRGELEAVRTDTPGHWFAQGWAYDPDTAGPVQVRVRTIAVGTAQTAPNRRSYLRTVVTNTTGIARSDVESREPAAGPNAGFDGLVVATPPLPPGVKVACAHALNVGPGEGRLIGCVRRP